MAKTNTKSKVISLWEKKVIRFLAVGCFNTLFDFSLLLFLYELIGLPKVIANSISVPLAITVSYFLNHRIVFRQKQYYSLGAYLRFLVITGFSAVAIQDVIIYIVTDHLLPAGNKIVAVAGHNLALATVELIGAKALGVGFGLIWNFLLYKYVVFRNDDKPDLADEIIIV